MMTEDGGLGCPDKNETVGCLVLEVILEKRAATKMELLNIPRRALKGVATRRNRVDTDARVDVLFSEAAGGRQAR